MRLSISCLLIGQYFDERALTLADPPIMLIEQCCAARRPVPRSDKPGLLHRCGIRIGPDAHAHRHLARPGAPRRKLARPACAERGTPCRRVSTPQCRAGRPTDRKRAQELELSDAEVAGRSGLSESRYGYYGANRTWRPSYGFMIRRPAHRYASDNFGNDTKPPISVDQ
jgi:hypothetical protein